MTITVVIITRNRSEFLDRCLSSIVNQVVSPQKVVVVDNGSTDQTWLTISKYRKIFPIRTIRETHVGIPYARNTGIKIAKGDIVAFLDDDCIADPQWILSIEKFFRQYRQAVGVIGNTLVANNRFIPALVEFAYNRRWILTHVNNPNTISNILSGVVVDFKNAAFRLKFIKQFLFSTQAPFGDAGSNEDAELGFRIYQKNKSVFYSPTIKASHFYSSTLSRLLWRNLWGGFSDKLLQLRDGVDLNSEGFRPKTQVWISMCFKISKHLPVEKRGIFFLLIFIFPFASRAGRIVAGIASILKWSISIPQR